MLPRRTPSSLLCLSITVVPPLLQAAVLLLHHDEAARRLRRSTASLFESGRRLTASFRRRARAAEDCEVRPLHFRFPGALRLERKKRSTCIGSVAVVDECQSRVVPDAGWVAGEEVPIHRTAAGDSVQAVFQRLATDYPV
jgi:hypothetical protein